MRTILITILAVSLGIATQVPPVRAQMVTTDEALTVAKNWVSLIIEKRGSWGRSKTAEVEWIEEFARGDRLLGYFCPMKPGGYVVVSLRKELAPVKAYSADSNLDPASDEGMADIIKGGMERILDRIEERLGPIETVPSVDLETILEINYRESWEELVGSREDSGYDELRMNYQEGDVLLSSNWKQGNPYNQDCPAPPGGDDCTEPRCVVGCVATAASQIMLYWCWPPYGEGSPYDDPYDWPNMPNTLLTTSPSAQINAVAELCHEVGISCDMHYCAGTGCASGASHEDMRDAYKDHFRGSTHVNLRDRNDFTAVGWFERIKTDLNANRPLQYGIPGHSIVADGWQEIGGGPLRQYHMNYGWAGWVPSTPEWAGYTNSNAWYTLDGLPGSNQDEEDIIEHIYPCTILYGTLSGAYELASFPYRYFDRDATGSSATFESGQYLQFLPNIVVTCTSTTGGSIKFYGSSSHNTRLFTRGDSSKGVRIDNGAIKLSRDGSLTFF